MINYNNKGIRLTETGAPLATLGLISSTKVSAFALACTKEGLDPDKTSLFALACKKEGLDPDKTSLFALACKKVGLDPDRTSFNDLDKKYPDWQNLCCK